MTANDLVQKIENENVKHIVLSVMKNDIPAYFFKVPASSTGKYHPGFSLGEGGLLRHTILVAYFAYRIADAWDCTPHERDVVVGAALMHDGLKQGLDAAGGHTVHEHPNLMADLLRTKYKDYPEAEEMASVVETHMGRWTKVAYSKVELKKPQKKLQYLLSAADMCAATRELELMDGFFAKA